jgi:hypothetical protein
MNKQRKIIFVGTTATIMMLTSLVLPLNPTKVKCESVVSNEDVSNRFYIEDFKQQLATDYQDIMIEEQISDEEESNQYMLNNENNDGVKVSIQKEKKKHTYSKEDLMLLAGVIQNEAGSDFCTNYHQRVIGSVIINRVKSDYFPNSIKKVITQKGQYDIHDENLYNPSKRAIKNARYVLDNGSILPSNCLFQSEFPQGDFVYTTIETPISTTYICGKN